MLRYSVVNTSSIIKRLRLFNYCSQNIQGTTPNRNLTKTCFPKIDRNTIEHLERLSLVDFGDERGIKIVEAAIKFADQLNEIDTSGVEPFITVLENEPLFLRDDTVTSEISRSELLSHSQMVIEDYYIAPVGNVAFIPKEKKYYNQENEIEKVETKNRMQKMIQHFAKNNFLKLSSDKSIKYGSNGSAVKHNIQNEWLISNFIHSDEPNFKFDNLTDNVEFKNAYSEVQPLTNSFPFSFTEIFESDLDLHHKSESLPPEIKDYFQINTGTVLRKQTLCSPDKSLQYFHRQQQERKIWWKKFSALPGRFVVSAINNDAKGKFQFVEIQAEFPWGLEVIELIKYMPLKLSFDSKFFKSAEGVKQIPHVVSTETLLEKTIITFLCDAYDGLNEETDYEMLRLHKKLAPYKIAFAGAASTEENRENLKDLATLLSKKIRKNGIPVLNLPDSCRVNVEAQYARNDAFGIPYTVFLNDATLNDGIIGIRSRDTTLKEQSHVSLIESYTEQLMRSY